MFKKSFHRYFDSGVHGLIVVKNLSRQTWCIIYLGKRNKLDFQVKKKIDCGRKEEN